MTLLPFIFLIQYKTSLWPTLTLNNAGKETMERYRSRIVDTEQIYNVY